MPSGRPSVMYYAPHLWDTDDYLVSVVSEDLDVCLESEDAEFRSLPCDIDVYNICMHVMNVHGLNPPRTVVEATDLYLCLRSNIALLL